MLRESYVAGATNTGNVTATVGDKLVLNWHGTLTQRDGVLQMFPVVRVRWIRSERKRHNSAKSKSDHI
jgi:hypothetical protein